MAVLANFVWLVGGGIAPQHWNEVRGQLHASYAAKSIQQNFMKSQLGLRLETF
jgi:hypothetical protein